MRGKKRLILLFLLLIVSCVLVSGVSIWFLYKTALQAERDRLTETVTSQARLIEAIARFDEQYSKDYPEGHIRATLAQIEDAHAQYNGLGETGEFTLARQEGDTIVFLLRHRHFDLDKPQPVDFHSKLAEPMRLALTGGSGTIIGLDYRGEQVLAAYEPVDELNLGIVAKIDMREIRAPFVRALFITSSAILLIMIASTILFYTIGSPILASLHKQNRQLLEEVEIRRETEANLKLLEDLLNSIIKSIPLPLVYHNSEGQVIGCNTAFQSLVGKTADELLRKTVFDLYPDRFAQLRHVTDQILLNEGGQDVQEAIIEDAQGNIRNMIVHKATYEGAEQGSVGGLITTLVDVTEIKQLNSTLRNRERLLSEMGSIARIGGWEHDLVTRKAAWTGEVYKIIGLDESEPIPGPDEHFEFYPPEHRAVLFEAYNKAIETGEQFDLELQCITAEDRLIWVRAIGRPEFEDGKCIKLSGTFQDITDRKMWEERLRQSQKMEAVGNLAGGVAHDYNNMLTIISGFTEMAMGKVSPDDPLYDDLVEIQDAAQRSVNITKQLLAFSRQQNIAPRALDLNDAIENSLNMLKRLIGEDIDLAWLPGKALWPVMLDPTQVDQILANLCVNARDAIEGNGKITIETDTITFDDEYCETHPGFIPGNFVMLAVSDDGAGMDESVKDKIFEPFFTTKGLGQGTGLGLSTIYGIVKQNAGFINVYSEPGKGTTFKVYIPQHLAAEVKQKEEQSVDVPLGQGETILIVEDDEHILKLSKNILENLGYSVLAANKPTEALHLARDFEAPLHLLITDVIMPEMNGRQLSEKLQKIRPDIVTLYMSGYTANVIAHRGVLEEGIHFIPKPFSRKTMAIRVRQVLKEALLHEPGGEDER